MNHTEQYAQISSWIDSYDNAEAVSSINKYIDNANLSQDIKSQLHLQVNCKVAHLKGEPYFHFKDEEFFLMDEKGNIRVFTTSFGALVVSIALKLRGFKVKMIHGAFYKVALMQTEPVENYELIKD